CIERAHSATAADQCHQRFWATHDRQQPVHHTPWADHGSPLVCRPCCLPTRETTSRNRQDAKNTKKGVDLVSSSRSWRLGGSVVSELGQHVARVEIDDAALVVLGSVDEDL